jgi:O-acetyl-ADP-ribose deacetylase (regulator of RNase III)
MEIEIRVIHGSILEVEAEAIVNAANGRGLMGGGVAGVLKRAGGPEVEQEAMRQAPIAVGQAVLTSGGCTRFRHIIHAPTMPAPAMRIPPENVAQATRAVLHLAEESGFHCIALPGLGTGVGEVPHAEAARLMIQEIQTFAKSRVSALLRTVLLVDLNTSMVQAWRAQLVHYGREPRPAGPPSRTH